MHVLRDQQPALDEADARLMAHAAFGLLNSTPYSTKPAGGKPAGSRSRAILREMTISALTAKETRKYTLDELDDIQQSEREKEVVTAAIVLPGAARA